MRDVTVYGTDRCEDTQRVLALLTSLRISHFYLNIERDARARQLVESWYPGAVLTPIVVLDMSGVRLVEPTDGQLASALMSDGVLIKRAC